jgi:acetolactate synthase-1/2/3 large subunit
VQGLDVVGFARTLTKYAAVVSDARQIRCELERAIHAATSGRPGPVWLDIPVDVQATELDIAALPTLPPPAASGAGVDVRGIARELCGLLDAARRPLLVVGQGVRNAGVTAEFRVLAGLLRVPVLAARLGHDIVGADLPTWLGQGGIRGHPHAAIVAREADLVISLGCGLATGFVGEDADAFSPDAIVVAIDIDPRQLSKSGVRIDRPVCTDVGPVVIELLALARGRPEVPGHHGWLARCVELRDRHAAVTGLLNRDPINTYWLVSRLEALSGPGDIFVVDTGSAYYVAGQALEFRRGQREITSASLVNMGAAVPMAVGAAFAAPGSRVLAMVGDGAIELNLQELATVSQYGLNIKVIVLNNGGYASIRESGDALVSGRRLNEPRPLDLVKVATTFELPYRRIDTVTQLDGRMADALALPGPVLVEVVCDSQQRLLRPAREHGHAAHDGARRLAAYTELAREGT